LIGQPPVRVLVAADLPAGRHGFSWNGLDERGELPCLPGSIFNRLEHPDFFLTRPNAVDQIEIRYTKAVVSDRRDCCFLQVLFLRQNDLNSALQVRCLLPPLILKFPIPRKTQI
jgi:hypothetical protein